MYICICKGPAQFLPIPPVFCNFALAAAGKKPALRELTSHSWAFHMACKTAEEIPGERPHNHGLQCYGFHNNGSKNHGFSGYSVYSIYILDITMTTFTNTASKITAFSNHGRHNDNLHL
jgi:hypothetical protein